MKTDSKKRSPFFSLGLALLALTAGCGARAHLTVNHGRSMRSAFGAQAANPGAGQQPHKLPGLDAQEASIVVKNYHRALATKGTQSQDDGGMVILAAPPSNQQPYLPPPSVPQDRK
jgi:hypothetical protein